MSIKCLIFLLGWYESAWINIRNVQIWNIMIQMNNITDFRVIMDFFRIFVKFCFHRGMFWGSQWPPVPPIFIRSPYGFVRICPTLFWSFWYDFDEFSSIFDGVIALLARPTPKSPKRGNSGENRLQQLKFRGRPS